MLYVLQNQLKYQIKFKELLKKILCIVGVGRFRILGGGGGRGEQGLEYWGGARGGGGANSQQAHDVVTTSMRRNDVADAMCPLGF